MTKNAVEKIGFKISMPFRYIKKSAANLFWGAADTTRVGLKKGIRATGKAASSAIWENKLENLYVNAQNNKYIKVGVMLLWLFLFSWIGHKVYMTSASETLHAGYILLTTVLLYYFFRDLKRMSSWHKRENIRGDINACEPEMLKKFLLTQSMTNKQKKLLSQKFQQQMSRREIIDIYEEFILSKMDKQTDEIVEKYSKAVGIGSAVSPRFSWDYILSILAFSKMLLDIAKVYRVKLSLKTFISVFIFGLAIISASTIVNQVIKQIIEKNQSAIAIFGGAGVWIVSKIVELAIPYYTIGTVGYAIQYTLRPIKPYS